MKLGGLLNWLQSLRIRVIIAVVVIFIGALWAVLAYVGNTLSRELQSVLWAQQYSIANGMASTINRSLQERLTALEATAQFAPKDLQVKPEYWQRFIEQKPVLQTLFNGGVLVHQQDGVAIASHPLEPDRVGVNYRGVDVVAAALSEGRSSIGTVVMGTKLNKPVFGMAVPLRDQNGNITGALSGVINLGLHNFLDEITKQGDAKTGWYFVVDPIKRQIVAASDSRRIMEILPAPGLDRGIDKALSGYEGMLTGKDKYGDERILTVRRIPATGWLFAVSLTTAEAYAPVQTLTRNLYVFGSLATLLVGVMTAWVLRRQLAPLGQAVGELERMLQSGSAIQELPVVRNDEVGQLVDGIHQMTRVVAQREAALHEVQSQLEGTLNAIPDLLFECDNEHRIVSFRAKRSELLALPPGDFIRRRFGEVMPKDAADICEASLEQARKHGYSGGLQYPLKIDGTVKWFELSVAFNSQSASTTNVFIVLVRDVTERRQAREALQQSRDELRALANRLQNGREAQRAHLAREIHDVLAQELTRLKIDISWMKRRLQTPVNDVVRENLLARAGQAMELVDSSITTVQRIATELRPVILDSLGLFAAVEWQVEDFAQRTGLSCTAEVPQNDSPPSREVAIVLFRILQESLTNIARHAHATRVQVNLKREYGEWVLTVIDDGVGITQANIDAPQSLGLLGMGERALAIGGVVQFDGNPGQGTTIVARIPEPGEST